MSSCLVTEENIISDISPLSVPFTNIDQQPLHDHIALSSLHQRFRTQRSGDRERTTTISPDIPLCTPPSLFCFLSPSSHIRILGFLPLAWRPQKGVDGFIDFVVSNVNTVDPEGRIRCPCAVCKNNRFLHPFDVAQHLYKKGFVYGYVNWTAHGEEFWGHTEVRQGRVGDNKIRELSYGPAKHVHTPLRGTALPLLLRLLPSEVHTPLRGTALPLLLRLLPLDVHILHKFTLHSGALPSPSYYNSFHQTPHSTAYYNPHFGSYYRPMSTSYYGPHSAFYYSAPSSYYGPHSTFYYKLNRSF
ncbi:hypothetical protein Taro_009773 [Colocasia esculenta]|uniref:Transposase-associated domain-containing protein n=1 Tax=Colocasia esculenta TaxID=4460 RepID=A0A843U1G5_COLES|nr:hypothetical protein [Colocasia esculenta]